MANPTYASTTPSTPIDTAYCTAAAFTTSEVDMGTAISVPYAEAIVAIVEVAIAGGPATVSLYVVLQGQFGDGTWADLAWFVTTATGAAQNFLLSNGVAGSGAVALTRASGTAPGSNGSNQAPLPTQLRFVGKATFTGGASPAATGTIRYKITGLS
jgi:hypothetical protein